MQAVLNRRQLLGSGVLLVAGWCGAMAFGHRPLVDAPGAACLGSAALTTLEKAFEALLDDEGAARACAAGVDAFLATGDPVAAHGLWSALVLLEHTGGAGLVSFARFSRLDKGKRTRVLREWEESNLGVRRQVFHALRRAAVFSQYSRPESWAAIGYDGPWVRG